MTPRRALFCLVVTSTALRLVWAGTIGLGHDEAYHYLFTVHPDWSYFDHPPMLALVESAGTGLFGSADPLALRSGFVALFAGSTVLLFRLTARAFGPWAGFYAALALNVSAYHTAAAGAFALPDGPLLFFWLLTLDRMAIALERPERIGPWLLMGLTWGGAMLSKYHAIFLPAGLLAYIAITPSARRLLRMPGPYLATLAGFVAFSPVIYWNATHHWVSFAFQGGRAVAGPGFRPLSLLGAVVGQAAYLLPWIWALLLIALTGSARRLVRGEASDAERMMLGQSITPLALFTAVACVKDVLPHWTLVGYLSAYPLLGRLWADRAEADPSRFRRRMVIVAIVPVLVAALVVIQYRTGLVPLDRLGKPTESGPGQSPNYDPTAELYGWDRLVATLREKGVLGDPATFLFTSLWFDSGHLGHAARGTGLPVVCYHPNDARSFACWSQPSDWVDRTGLLVTTDSRPMEPACYERWFDRIEDIGPIPIVRNGRLVRTFRVYRCVRQRAPFPFEYVGGPKRPPEPRTWGARTAVVAGGDEPAHPHLLR